MLILSSLTGCRRREDVEDVGTRREYEIVDVGTAGETVRAVGVERSGILQPFRIEAFDRLQASRMEIEAAVTQGFEQTAHLLERALSVALLDLDQKRWTRLADDCHAAAENRGLIAFDIDLDEANPAAPRKIVEPTNQHLDGLAAGSDRRGVERPQSRAGIGNEQTRRTCFRPECPPLQLQALPTDFVSPARLEHTHDVRIGLNRDHVARQADEDRGIITMIGANIDRGLVAGAKPRQQLQ